MRDPATYRVARRNLAREIMRRLKDEGKPHDWRAIWLSVQTSHKLARAARKAAP